MMQKVSEMVDMARTPEEIENNMTPPSAADMPIYPYGLSICLTQDELEKLGVDYSDWEVGDHFDLTARAKITSITENETEGGKKCRVEMQIVALSGPSENQDQDENDEHEDAEYGQTIGTYGY